MQHELKLIDPYFTLVKEGKMGFNVRHNDRQFQKGDEIVFNRYRSTSENVDEPAWGVYLDENGEGTNKELCAKIRAKVDFVFSNLPGVDSNYVTLYFTVNEG